MHGQAVPMAGGLSQSPRPAGVARTARAAPVPHAQHVGNGVVTLGAEFCLKTEYYNAPDFFLRPVFERYTAVGQRVLLHADLRTAVDVTR